MVEYYIGGGCCCCYAVFRFLSHGMSGLLLMVLFGTADLHTDPGKIKT